MADAADRQRMAEAVGEAMFARDIAAHAFNMTVDEIRPGFARLRMPVRDDMVNGHDILHGGMCFTLADTAFAYACNSHNHVAVASSCTITFVAPGKRGDLLTAVAVESIRFGRSGVTDVTVTNQDGTVIALFRGNSRLLKGNIIDWPGEGGTPGDD